MRLISVMIAVGSLLGCGMFDEPVEVANVLPVLEIEDVVEFDFEVVDEAEPIAFLVDSITIEQLGSQDSTGFIAMLLAAQWDYDISEQNLNIVFVVKSYDDETGDAVLQVGFGIGDDPAALCLDEATLSEDLTLVAPDRVLGLGFDLVSIYSEDEAGVPFNCNPEPSILDAVPLRSVGGDMTVTEDWSAASGLMKGCLSEEEATTLCTCVGPCTGDPHPSCGGCPDGSAPLSEKLGGIVTTPECTEKLGKPAFDLHAGLTAVRIPLPPQCGDVAPADEGGGAADEAGEATDEGGEGT